MYYNAHFKYNEHNQPLGFNAHDGTTLIKSSHYIYDCFNRRVASVIDQAESGSSVATTYFVYAGQAAWQLAEEYPSEESDTVGNSYVYGLYIDEILTMRDHASANDDDYFYHQDDLFSVYAMTDDAGDVVERYEYGDYGQVSVFDEDGADRSVSSYGNRHTYTGRLLDAELTLDDGGQVLQYRHRYMSTGSGRFLQRDPELYIDGMNLYIYVSSRPTFYVDPFGLGCTVTFECTFSGSTTSGCSRDCSYICVETKRVDSLTGETMCADLPRAPIIRFDSTQTVSKLCLCTLGFLGKPPSCPANYTDKTIYYQKAAGNVGNCSRGFCRSQCDSAKQIAEKACGKAGKVAGSLCKAAAGAAAVICRDACNAICKNP